MCVFSAWQLVLKFVLCCRVEQQDAACVSIRCAAHSVQRLLNDLENTPLVKTSLNTMGKLIAALDDPEKQDKLKQFQKTASGGKEEGCIPIKPVETRCCDAPFFFFLTPPFVYHRWSSQIYAMERLIRLKPFVTIVVPGVIVLYFT